MKATPDHLAISVLHIDAHLLVVNKPSGLLSVPGRRSDPADCLTGQLAGDFPEALIVHRLDADTSGLMMLARDEQTHRLLSSLFEKREVTKRYLAVVAGHPDPASGRIDLPIRKDMTCSLPPRHIVDPEQGKPSITDYRTLGRRDESARLELLPLTGRSHQLRVHLAHRGHSIVGDPIYAPPEIQALSPRLLLHASYLEFRHPVSGRPICISSPAPF